MTRLLILKDDEGYSPGDSIREPDNHIKFMAYIIQQIVNVSNHKIRVRLRPVICVNNNYIHAWGLFDVRRWWHYE